MKAIEITPHMIDAIKRAVKGIEESWDAQLDFEICIGRSIDGMQGYLEGFAACSTADAVDEEYVRGLIRDLVHHNTPPLFGIAKESK